MNSRTPVTRYTDALRPDAVLEMRVSAAYRDGQATGQALAPRRIPWDPQGATAVERCLALAWAKGYTAGNPAAV